MAMTEQRVWGVRQRLFERLVPMLADHTLAHLVEAASICDGLVKGLKHPGWPLDPWDGLKRLALMVVQHTATPPKPHQAGLRLACTTNKELRHTRRVLAVTGLEGFFDLVIGGDSLAEKKPHRSVLEHVMQTLQCRAERTAHVGDSSIDVQAARNAGVSAWVVPYGYNGGQPIESANPDRIFDGLLDVAHHALAARAVS